jgi:hypothetical protein
MPFDPRTNQGNRASREKPQIFTHYLTDARSNVRPSTADPTVRSPHELRETELLEKTPRFSHSTVRSNLRPSAVDPSPPEWARLVQPVSPPPGTETCRLFPGRYFPRVLPWIALLVLHFPDCSPRRPVWESRMRLPPNFPGWFRPLPPSPYVITGLPIVNGAY